MDQLVTIRDKVFKPFISREAIASRVKELAQQISEDCSGNNPLFVAVLNGSFMFASDLLKEIKTDCAISFIKISSYRQMQSTGEVTELIGLVEDIRNRQIIVLEDIVDSGLTIDRLHKALKERGAGSIKVATLLFKPAAFRGEVPPEYIGYEIDNDFVVGYGMDYEGSGRNLDEIYVLD